MFICIYVNCKWTRFLKAGWRGFRSMSGVCDDAGIGECAYRWAATANRALVNTSIEGGIGDDRPARPRVICFLIFIYTCVHSKMTGLVLRLVVKLVFRWRVSSNRVRAFRRFGSWRFLLAAPRVQPKRCDESSDRWEPPATLQALVNAPSATKQICFRAVVQTRGVMRSKVHARYIF